MKLTPKSLEIFEYVKENGGRVSVDEISTATGRPKNSINANINDLAKKGLALRDKIEGEEGEAAVTYVVLTADGKSFVQPEDEE